MIVLERSRCQLGITTAFQGWTYRVLCQRLSDSQSGPRTVTPLVTRPESVEPVGRQP
jgi:hypothetical protein